MIKNYRGVTVLPLLRPPQRTATLAPHHDTKLIRNNQRLIVQNHLKLRLNAKMNVTGMKRLLSGVYHSRKDPKNVKSTSSLKRFNDHMVHDYQTPFRYSVKVNE